MLPLLLVALSCGAAMGDSFFPSDLSAVKWEHAVNSKDELANALKSNAHMLEADVSVNAAKQPIMAHPPSTTSDLTLQEFLDTVLNSTSKKGIKLDFKTTEAYTVALPLLQTFKKSNFSSPVWLNADILKGPGAEDPKVDAKVFLERAKANFDTWTLSVGWTTVWTGMENYTLDDVKMMNATLLDNKIDQPVTFAVRAAIAAKSEASMKSLVTVLTNSTLTVWSSEHDKNISFDALRKTVNDVGRSRVFLDLPKDQLKSLNSGTRAVLSSACVMLAVGAYAARFW